jgi:hypothetical protein
MRSLRRPPGSRFSPHGWDCLDPDEDEDGARWRHPDATAPHSATICYGQLFVYSTNTPFEPTESGNPHGYTKFRAFGVLNQLPAAWLAEADSYYPTELGEEVGDRDDYDLAT